MSKHLKILGKGDANLLGDVNVIRNFIMVAIENLGMQPLGEPIIHDVELDVKKLGLEPFEDSGGITTQIVGYNTLSTSHIAIHTFPLENQFHLDIYSCREFNREYIGNFVKEYFRCNRVKISDLTYATKWD